MHSLKERKLQVIIAIAVAILMLSVTLIVTMSGTQQKTYAATCPNCGGTKVVERICESGGICNECGGDGKFELKCSESLNMCRVTETKKNNDSFCPNCGPVASEIVTYSCPLCGGV